MRKLQLIIIFIILLIACEDRESNPAAIPLWLEPRIEELENGECIGCSVTRYTYREEYFYHVYCNTWSCVECEVYRYNGARVNWGEDIDPVDYNQNRTNPVIIWECGMNTETP